MPSNQGGRKFFLVEVSTSGLTDIARLVRLKPSPHNAVARLIHRSHRTYRSHRTQGTQADVALFQILRHSKWVIQNALYRVHGPNTKDLVLNKAVVVEGFYSNIVSQALVLKANVWYCGLDCTLRVGPLVESVVVAQLKLYHIAF
ncbi:hypothetical protein VTK56DRAFT_6892 [Thermocarpiscus australiensis]